MHFFISNQHWIAKNHKQLPALNSTSISDHCYPRIFFFLNIVSSNSPHLMHCTHMYCHLITKHLYSLRSFPESSCLSSYDVNNLQSFLKYSMYDYICFQWVSTWYAIFTNLTIIRNFEYWHLTLVDYKMRKCMLNMCKKKYCDLNYTDITSDL